MSRAFAGMNQRALRLKEMPTDNSAMAATLAEMESLFARLPPPCECREFADLLSVIEKKRGNLCILQNKVVPTARTCEFTVIIKPAPWLVDVMKALRGVLAANKDRKIERRR